LFNPTQVGFNFFNFYYMNIFVSGLPFSLTREELESAFQAFGNVTSARIIKDRDTGRSRGFGFVEMDSDDAAHSAISALDQSELKGRRINVKIAEERASR
jgi:RNA recognition motif-containing protein